MKPKVILFEGYDGSGKTTLIKNFEKFLIENGKTCLLVGRDYNNPIKSITKIIQDKDSEICPVTEILLRLARENERTKVLNQELHKYDYVILDRSIVSATSWINFYSKPFDKFTNIITELVDSIGSCYLVYCYLSFEDTWTRVNSRQDKTLSKKEEKGKEANQKMFEALRKTFIEFQFGKVNKIEITTDKSREDCLIELLTLLSLT